MYRSRVFLLTIVALTVFASGSISGSAATRCDRLLDRLNARLAGASGTRSEFNGDFAWSDYVVQKGYAYVSQNKGIYNLFLLTAADPLGCRLNPTSGTFVHFFDNDPAAVFTRWNDVMIAATEI